MQASRNLDVERGWGVAWGVRGPSWTLHFCLSVLRWFPWVIHGCSDGSLHCRVTSLHLDVKLRYFPWLSLGRDTVSKGLISRHPGKQRGVRSKRIWLSYTPGSEPRFCHFDKWGQVLSFGFLLSVGSGYVPSSLEGGGSPGHACGSLLGRPH